MQDVSLFETLCEYLDDLHRLSVQIKRHASTGRATISLNLLRHIARLRFYLWPQRKDAAVAYFHHVTKGKAPKEWMRRWAVGTSTWEVRHSLARDLLRPLCDPVKLFHFDSTVLELTLASANAPYSETTSVHSSLSRYERLDLSVATYLSYILHRVSYPELGGPCWRDCEPAESGVRAFFNDNPLPPRTMLPDSIMDQIRFPSSWSQPLEMVVIKAISEQPVLIYREEMDSVPKLDIPRPGAEGENVIYDRYFKGVRGYTLEGTSQLASWTWGDTTPILKRPLYMIDRETNTRMAEEFFGGAR